MSCDTGTKPQWSGCSHIARIMDTFHASKQSSHGSLAADNAHGDWLGATKGGHGSPNMGDDSTGIVLSYQLADAVHQSKTMDN